MKASDTLEGFISSTVKKELFYSVLPQPPGFMFVELLQMKKYEKNICKNQDSPNLSFVLRILLKLFNEHEMNRIDISKMLSKIL